MKINTGAEIVIKALVSQGVDTVFGYPGGAVLPIYDEIFKEKNLRIEQKPNFDDHSKLDLTIFQNCLSCKTLEKTLAHHGKRSLVCSKIQNY